jgi:hypothetical protein
VNGSSHNGSEFLVEFAGVALYRAFGFQEVERFVVTVPDDVTLDAVVMERPIDPPCQLLVR